MMRESGGNPSWTDADGIHSIVEGQKPTPEMVEEMEKAYRENIKNSPMWNIMVKEYGKEKAEALLLEFKVKID